MKLNGNYNKQLTNVKKESFSTKPLSRTIESSSFDSRQDWRHFFTEDEMGIAQELMQSGKDPNDTEYKDDTLEDGSESCPSEGNLDLKELYDVIYLEKNKALAQINLKHQAEQAYSLNFNNFVKHVKQRCGSRD